MREFETLETVAVGEMHPASSRWAQPDDEVPEWYVVAELPLTDGDLQESQTLRYRLYAEAVRRAQQASRETHGVYAVYEVIEDAPELVVLVYDERLYMESGL